jgi:hypothetical protein
MATRCRSFLWIGHRVSMLPLHRHEMISGRNRVTPAGDIAAIPLRRCWTGSRGILHSGPKVVRFHTSDLWIICALKLGGRWREQWRPHQMNHRLHGSRIVRGTHRRQWVG